MSSRVQPHGFAVAAASVPATASPRLLAVLPTFRRQRLLAETLDAVLSQTRPPDRLLVVDNETSEETRRIVEAHSSRIEGVSLEYCSAEENLGSAGGWELGMRRLLEEAGDEDWLLTLDDDDPPQRPDDIQRMFDFALEQRRLHPDLAAVGIVGARFDWKRGVLERLSDDLLAGPVTVDYVGSGHLAMYRMGVMRQLGPFRGELFFGHTEVEYGLRLRRAGYRIVAHGRMWKERREAAGRIGLKTKRRWTAHSGWRRYYVNRNYIVMMREMGRTDLALRRAFVEAFLRPLCTLAVSPRTAWCSAMMSWRAAIDGWRGRMGRTLEPTIDGQKADEA